MTRGAVGIVFGMLPLLLLASVAVPPPVGWVVSLVGMPSVLAILFAVRALLGSPPGPRVIVTSTDRRLIVEQTQWGGTTSGVLLGEIGEIRSVPPPPGAATGYEVLHGIPKETLGPRPRWSRPPGFHLNARWSTERASRPRELICEGVRLSESAGPALPLGRDPGETEMASG